MDVCLFLLKHSAPPESISWVMPRDSWLLDRANLQPKLFADSISRGFALTLEAIAQATSVEDVLQRVEACGQLIRFDDKVWPTMYRCATVTRAELAQLRRVRDVIRKGHVQRLTAEKIVLDQGEAPTSLSTLHIDCTADGLQNRPAKPVFSGPEITLQAVRTCQQVFSAAFIARVESTYTEESVKNELCTPVPHPDSEVDFLRCTLVNARNAFRWAQEPELNSWLQTARLDGYNRPMDDGGPTEEQLAIMQILLENSGPAIAKLEQLLSGPA